jgi:hypothetical protein
MCNRILPIRIEIKRFDNFHLWPAIRNFVKTRSVVSGMKHADRWKQLVHYVFVLCSNVLNKIIGNILIADYQVPGEDSRDHEVVAMWFSQYGRKFGPLPHNSRQKYSCSTFPFSPSHSLPVSNWVRLFRWHPPTTGNDITTLIYSAFDKEKKIG